MPTKYKRVIITITPGLEKDLAKAKEFYGENSSEIFRRALLQLMTLIKGEKINEPK